MWRATAHVICDIVVAGTVPRGKALRRDGARAGDAIYVSGALGGSALGLSTERGKSVEAAQAARTAARARALSARASATPPPRWISATAFRSTCAVSASPPDCARRSPRRPSFPAPPWSRRCTAAKTTNCCSPSPPARACRANSKDCLSRELVPCAEGSPGAVLLDGAPLPALGYDHLRSL